MAAPQAHRARLVLVVDDEPDLLGIMERALCDAGYGVLAASDGLRALGLAERVTPDILVTDLRMEGLNGFDLARLVTAKHPETRVLLVSGGDPDHTQVPWPLVRKPFSLERFVEAVDRLLETPGPRPA
jgi:DNA-binding NtrC family response regulator